MDKQRESGDGGNNQTVEVPLHQGRQTAGTPPATHSAGSASETAQSPVVVSADNDQASDQVPQPNDQSALPTTSPELQQRNLESASATSDAEVPEKPVDMLSWSAAEFVSHPKPNSWYVLLGGAMIALAVVVWLLTKDIFATVAVVLSLALLGVYARRQPGESHYALDNTGLTIGQRHYLYSEFRSFSLTHEGGLTRLELTPLKRFAMYSAIYCATADEEKVVAALSDFLPMDEAGNDITDTVMRRLHF